MKTLTANKETFGLFSGFLKLVQKLVKQPDHYPVKYYKKADRMRKTRKERWLEW